MNAPQNEAALDGFPAARDSSSATLGSRSTAQQHAAEGQPSEPLQPDGQPNAGAAGDRPRPDLPKIIPFSTLARCGDEIWIENEGQIYRLRKTRQGKLILTK